MSSNTIFCLRELHHIMQLINPQLVPLLSAPISKYCTLAPGYKTSELQVPKLAQAHKCWAGNPAVFINMHSNFQIDLQNGTTVYLVNYRQYTPDIFNPL